MTTSRPVSGTMKSGPSRNDRIMNNPVIADTTPVGQGPAYVLLFATTFLWAVGVVIARGVHEEIPLIGLSFWRWFTACFVLIPFMWKR